jgi:hypothetical protein
LFHFLGVGPNETTDEDEELARREMEKGRVPPRPPASARDGETRHG